MQLPPQRAVAANRQGVGINDKVDRIRRGSHRSEKDEKQDNMAGRPQNAFARHRNDSGLVAGFDGDLPISLATSPRRNVRFSA
jgi:hypothetical protein